MHKNLLNNFDYLISINPADHIATKTGSTVDGRGFTDWLCIITVGAVAIADGDNYFTFKVQESVDDSTWTDLASTGYQTGDTWDKIINATGEANKIWAMQIKPTKRYLRVVATETGTAQAIFGAHFLGEKREQPATTE